MADTHGQHPAPHDDHDDDHATAPPEEDAIRTPAWLTYAGLALLVVGALGSYLWIYPGTMNPTVTADDGGLEGGTADASAAEGGTPVAAAPAQ